MLPCPSEHYKSLVLIHLGIPLGIEFPVRMVIYEELPVCFQNDDIILSSYHQFMSFQFAHILASVCGSVCPSVILNHIYFVDRMEVTKDYNQTQRSLPKIEHMSSDITLSANFSRAEREREREKEEINKKGEENNLQLFFYFLIKIKHLIFHYLR